MKLPFVVPRPSLLGLSRKQILLVRNSILQLYIPPEDPFEIAPPRSTKGVYKVMLVSGVHPQFTYRHNEKHVSLWLKCQGGLNPYFDYYDESMETAERIKFNDPKARLVALLIKSFSKHFPFVPTQHYLQNKGNFIA